MLQKESPLMKYVRGVLGGKYRGDDLFASILQAVVLKHDKEERGVGMQNFRYTPELMEFSYIIQAHSPKAYEFLKQYLPMPNLRTIKCVSPLAYVCRIS
jgi:hypothetical protein